MKQDIWNWFPPPALLKLDLSKICLYIYEFLYTCLSVYHMHAWCLLRPEERVRFPGTGVRWFWAAVWVLESEPRYFTRAARALNYWVSSATPVTLFLQQTEVALSTYLLPSSPLPVWLHSGTNVQEVWFYANVLIKILSGRCLVPYLTFLEEPKRQCHT